jgi:hypothetical protein
MRGLVVVSVAHCAGVCSAVGAHGWNINKSNLFLAWPYRLCPGVSTAVLCPLWVGVVVSGTCRGVVCVGCVWRTVGS